MDLISKLRVALSGPQARRYTAGVMETAAAWVRKALKAEGKVTACI